jgi:hypothetical protein
MEAQTEDLCFKTSLEYEFPRYNIFIIRDRVHIVLHISLVYMYKEENFSTLGAELVRLEVALLDLHIWEVLGSSLGWDTSYAE